VKLARQSRTSLHPKKTAVSEAAKKLREIILAKGDGAYLGSREELVRTLEVGHVTLQQAARLLERERLLVVRRGPNGGYFARWPDEAGVEEAIAIYLRVKNAGFPQALVISNALLIEMAKLAAQSSDEVGRAEMAALRDRITSADLSDPRELFRIEDVFGDAIFKLANNPLGELILLVTRRLYFEGGAKSLLWTLSDVEAWRNSRLNIINAILDHDEQMVDLITRRFQATVRSRTEAQERLVREGLPVLEAYGAPDETADAE
jgi:GntR family transcriptional repressor for pyruvate dehydrogenase complex